MAGRKRVGIVDVAKALGLSTYTVSRAIAGHSDVSASTRDRVLSAADAMGYTANAFGSMLRKGKTDTICVFLTPSPDHYLDAYFSPIITGLDRVISPAGYSILLAGAAPGEAEKDVLRRLIQGGRADAAVLTRVRRDDWRARQLRQWNFPFAMLGRDADEPSTAYVDVDHRGAAGVAVRWLVERGHRRIGLLNTPADVHASIQLHAGWTQALIACGLPHPEAWVREGRYTVEDGRRVAAGLLDCDPRPTALICGNDLMAIGAAEAARAAGLTVGSDLSIIGIDDIALAAFCQPPLTTFRTALTSFGEALGRQILAMLAGETASSLLITPTLIERASAGPLPSPPP